MSLVKKSHYPWFGELTMPLPAQLDRLWTSEWIPAVNIVDEEKQYKIELAAPGLQKEDFKVSIDHGMLHVSAESKEEKEEKTKNYRRREYTCTAFQRSLSLPDDIKEDEIKANYVNGILYITVQKKAPALTPPKQINVG